MDVSVGRFYVSDAFCSSADGDICLAFLDNGLVFTAAVTRCDSSAMCSYGAFLDIRLAIFPA